MQGTGLLDAKEDNGQITCERDRDEGVPADRKPTIHRTLLRTISSSCVTTGIKIVGLKPPGKIIELRTGLSLSRPEITTNCASCSLVIASIPFTT
jgi:hypothetical protein